MLAGLTRLGLLGVPLVAALLVVRLLHQFVLGGIAVWAQLAISVVAGIVVALLAERATRRFLPLPALLRMSMLFPGRAPSRLLVTRRAGSNEGLSRMLAARDPDPQQAATTMMALIGALAAHDKRSRGHSERVRLFTDMVAEELTLTRADRDRLCWAALLHDVGKLEIATSILNKPGPLDDSEWVRMRRHPADGARLCAPLLEWLGPSGKGIVEHHEKYDGSGYPNGLAGHDISLAGRVIAVVDAYETMTAARAYRKPVTTRAARQELAKCASTHFDPVIVRAFLAVSVPRMMWATGPLSLITHLPYLRDLQLIGAQVGAASASSAAQVAGVTALAVGTAVVPMAAATASPAPHPRYASVPHVVGASTPSADPQQARRPAANSPKVSAPSKAKPRPKATKVTPQPKVTAKPTSKVTAKPTSTVKVKPTTKAQAKPTTKAKPASKVTPQPKVTAKAASKAKPTVEAVSKVKAQPTVTAVSTAPRPASKVKVQPKVK
jgi:HD-GYP domain-containing protein (c-di-GMP phosphodiesterase class II)